MIDREDSPFSHIRGYSPRYSPPEVFARVHLRNASSSIDDDQVSDVYSMGVVMWETTTRQVRRTRMTWLHARGVRAWSDALALPT